MPYYVPFDKQAEKIYLKYLGILPKVDNGTYNRYLREACSLLNIKKYLTTHTARKTFATVKRHNGWSTESIADMLGHSTIKTTETYYISRGRARIENEFERLGYA